MGKYKIHLAGESFGKRQNHISNAWEGQKVFLVREPGNKYDKNAVLATLENGNDLGYIGKDNSEWIAEIIDGGRPIEAKIKVIIGGYGNKKSLGVILEIFTGEDAGKVVFSKSKPSAARGGVWVGLILLSIFLVWNFF